MFFMTLLSLFKVSFFREMELVRAMLKKYE